MRETECFSMYSDMSSRIMERSSSNRNSARARASSVFPTPVGPRKMNEPIGRLGSESPARLRRIEFATRSSAVSCPITRWRRRDSIVTSFCASPSSSRPTGIPVHLADQLGDVFFAHFFLEHAAVLLHFREIFLRGGHFLLRGAQFSVADFRDLREVPGAFQALLFRLELFDLFLQGADLGDGRLLHLPLGFARARFLAQRGQLDFELFQPFLRVRVGFVQQRLALDFQVQDAPLDFVNFNGQRIELHAQARGGFIDQIDGLVRKKTVGDIAIGERGGRQNRGVLDAHAVMQFVAFLQAAQNCDRVC